MTINAAHGDQNNPAEDEGYDGADQRSDGDCSQDAIRPEYHEGLPKCESAGDHKKNEKASVNATLRFGQGFDFFHPHLSPNIYYSTDRFLLF